LREITEKYSNLEVLAADLFTDEGVRVVEERILDASRPINQLVNNAGFGTQEYFDELDPDRLDREVGWNIQATDSFVVRGGFIWYTVRGCCSSTTRSTR